ncbi:3-hydroxyanthranilate 3,4-dioxygenase [Actinomadura rubteroloni]|uniref:3-hydroxyanthranilate 3,4-dioxygenase n=1 Tax=Actinomadura rubteroloni TaxID=1926885 RepID=A0A2P4UDP9_9ACTN|nr:hypothetical protein [Actinomadura rubteroloni]POM23165.1 3-hydroxyanthranilate 3,4-dioxygenase [Actinomadura rubteroloni]
MTRRRMLHAFKAAAEIGNYQDEAVLPADTDPQIYLSRNWLPQPFHLICEKDTVLSQLSGSAHVHLRDSSVNRFRMDVGDHVYVPAGTPHQIVPVEEGVTIRYQPLAAGRQGAAWYCPECGAELHRYEWQHDNDGSAVALYAEAVARFSADLDARTCGKCSAVHPEISLEPYGWTTEPA